jgi:hypothetical protein
MRTRHITSQRAFLPPRAPQGDGAAIFGTTRIVLIGMQRDVSPPLVFGDQLLQRMGVICAGQDEPEIAPEGDMGIHVLPPLQRLARMDEAHPPRLVRGEILRCERGTFYEHCRGQIRPLHRLVAGPRGEILELPSAPGGRGSRRAEQCEPDEASVHHGAARPEPRPPVPADVEPAEKSDKPGSATFRALFPEPGERRMIAWGEFKDVLESQISHPERLRGSHQLPCDVQIYEVIVPQTLEALATAALGIASTASQLRPLTAELARKLGVAAPGRKVPASRPGLLGRGERYYRLNLASDPTACAQRPAGGPTAPSLPLSAEIPRDPAMGKNAIPERFLKPWELRFTRDEVLYDMNVVAAFQGRIGAMIRRLARWPRWRSALRKWQVLLSGKSFDEQLWAVRPPDGGLTHHAVRQWATRTLELAGYQPRTMLLEWEIFWRRKGH